MGKDILLNYSNKIPELKMPWQRADMQGYSTENGLVFTEQLLQKI